MEINESEPYVSMWTNLRHKMLREKSKFHKQVGQHTQNILKMDINTKYQLGTHTYAVKNIYTEMPRNDKFQIPSSRGLERGYN